MLIEKIGEIFHRLNSKLTDGDFKSASEIFIELVNARNDLAKEKGYLNYLDFQKKSVQEIPNSDWKKYLDNRDEFASKYGAKEDQVHFYPHFLSKIPSVNISFPDGAYPLFELFPAMKNIENKIDLVIEGSTAKFQYFTDTDRYLITIADTNLNQKIAMLIHELSHVTNLEMKNHKINSVYESERGAYSLEFEIAGSISDEYLIADIREYLMCIVRSEFDEAIFMNPTLFAPTLFNSLLNKYFGNFSDKDDYRYLRDEKILMKPLSDLSGAVAVVNVLT